MKVRTREVCQECGRVFDLLDEDEAAEWFMGHDCEAPLDEPVAFDHERGEVF